jgi:hypothetical protein
VSDCGSVVEQSFSRFSFLQDSRDETIHSGGERHQRSVFDTNYGLETAMSEEQVRRSLKEIRRLKDRLQDENLVLRAEVDQALMFEEIIEASAALKSVLSRIS